MSYNYPQQRWSGASGAFSQSNKSNSGAFASGTHSSNPAYGALSYEQPYAYAPQQQGDRQGPSQNNYQQPTPQQYPEHQHQNQQHPQYAPQQQGDRQGPPQNNYQQPTPPPAQQQQQQQQQQPQSPHTIKLRRGECIFYRGWNLKTNAGTNYYTYNNHYMWVTDSELAARKYAVYNPKEVTKHTPNQDCFVVDLNKKEVVRLVTSHPDFNMFYQTNRSQTGSIAPAHVLAIYGQPTQPDYEELSLTLVKYLQECYNSSIVGFCRSTFAASQGNAVNELCFFKNALSRPY